MPLMKEQGFHELRATDLEGRPCALRFTFWLNAPSRGRCAPPGQPQGASIGEHGLERAGCCAAPGQGGEAVQGGVHESFGAGLGPGWCRDTPAGVRKDPPRWGRQRPGAGLSPWPAAVMAPRHQKNHLPLTRRDASANLLRPQDVCNGGHRPAHAPLPAEARRCAGGGTSRRYNPRRRAVRGGRTAGGAAPLAEGGSCLGLARRPSMVAACRGRARSGAVTTTGEGRRMLGEHMRTVQRCAARSMPASVLTSDCAPARRCPLCTGQQIQAAPQGAGTWRHSWRPGRGRQQASLPGPCPAARGVGPAHDQPAGA